MKANKLITIAIFMLALFNVGNYSFLSYTFSGKPLSSSVSNVFAWLRLPIAIVPAVLILAGLVRVRYLQKFMKLNWDILFMLFVGLLSALLSSNPVRIFFYFLWFFGAFILLAAWLWSQRSNRWELRLLRLAEFLIYPNVVVIPLLLINVSNVFSTNFEMSFTSKNFYAYSLLMVFIGLLILIFLKRELFFTLNPNFHLLRYSIITYTSLLITSGFFLLISGRRSPLIAAILSLIAFYALRSRRSNNQRLISVFVFTLILTLSYFSSGFLINKYKGQFYTLERISRVSLSGTSITENEYTNSLGDRDVIWESYMSIVQKYPIFGVGIGNAQNVHENTYSGWSYGGYSPHNTYLAILVEQGILGALFFAIIWIRNLFFISRLTGQAKLVYLALSLSTLFICYFEYNSSPGQILFYPFLLVMFWPRVRI